MCLSNISNVIYHKFSHGAVFYMLNGKNVNVMLESLINQFRLLVQVTGQIQAVQFESCQLYLTFHLTKSLPNQADSTPKLYI